MIHLPRRHADRATAVRLFAALGAALLLAFATQSVRRTAMLDVGGANDGAFVAGFYKPETVLGTSARWTDGTGRILLRHVGPFPATVRIRWAGHPARDPDRIQVSVGGSEAIAEGAPRWQTLEIRVANGSDGDDLTLSMLSVRSPSGNDNRMLGVLIDSVEVETGGLAALRFPPTRQAAWTFLLFLGVMIGSASAVRMVVESGRGWSTGVAAAATVLVFAALVYRRFDIGHLVSVAAILVSLGATFITAVQLPPVRRRLESVSISMATWRPRVAVFVVAAVGVLALRFYEAFLSGWVPAGPDGIYRGYPWHAYAPAGFVGPRNPTLSDIPEIFYPAVVFAANAVRNGSLPLWNASIDAGNPFVAAYQSAVFSPFTALAYVLPLPQATVVIAMSVLLLGGVGMFVFVRSLGFGWPAATVAGIAYLVNTFSTSWLWPYNASAVVAWVPWLLWAGERVVRRGTAGEAMLVAALTGLLLLSGHPETAFKALLLTGSYGVFCWLWRSRRPRVFGLLVVGYGAGALLTAFQILPFAEYMGEGRVLRAREEFAVNHFFAPFATLITAIVPNFLGHPADAAYLVTQNRYGYPANYFDHLVYPGMAIWLLAGVGMAAGWRDARARFFGAMAVVSLLIMYGAPGFVELISILPLLRVTYLARFGLLVIVATIILAAIGVEALERSSARGSDGSMSSSERFRPGRPLWLPAGALAAVVLGAVSVSWLLMRPVLQQAGLSGFGLRYSLLAVALALGGLWLIVAHTRQKLSSAVFVPAIVVLLLVDLVPFARSFRPMMPAEEVFPAVPEIEAIKRDPELFRVTGYDFHLVPNTATVYGLQDFRGYDAIGLERYQALLDAGFETIAIEGSTRHLFNRPTVNPLLDLLNVKYIFVPPEVTLPPGHYTLLEGTRAPVYRNEGAFPRAFLVDSYRVEDDAAARRILAEGGTDLRRVVLLAGEPSGPEQPEAAGREGVGSAVVRMYSDSAVEIETEASGRRLLVMTDVYYPGWRATVDGQPVEILRANTAFRAVSVPVGRHVVRFDYRPLSFKLGLLVSGSTALGLMAFTLAATRSTRRGRSPRHRA
jgi:hypothetical protein